MARYKTIIGRAELVDFPEFLLADVPVKTDSGAYLSAIHASDIVEIAGKKKGSTVLRCKLLGNHPSYTYSREVEFKSFEIATIENSFGHKEKRYKVELKMKLGGKVFKAPFTLADRSTKVFPILIGRTTLNNRFLVDTTIVHVDRTVLKEKLKDWLNKDDQSDDEE